MGGLMVVDRQVPVARCVAEQILQGIRHGRYPVGQLLPSEQEIAALCGVSRPSVREALSALQFAGYVESRKGTRSLVIERELDGPPDAEVIPAAGGGGLVDQLEARLVLEPEVLALAACDPDLACLDGAAALVGGMGVAVAEPALAVGTDLRVHIAILSTCRNRALREQAIGLLRVALDPHWQVARERAWSGVDLPRRWTDHHRRIVDAVIAGDPGAAAAVGRDHLLSVVRNLRDHGGLPASERRALTALMARAQRRIGAPSFPSADRRRLSRRPAPRRSPP